ncbi:MAG: glycosyltransferase family 9 protein [Myxococcaceae bacterium]|jgi:heptosyltransferase-3|nr:glycosyltransferase family 9 protein [Myxococcaceae bacterium]MCA3015756.1 glycosyltransferase family 9 protein [Myxococcaceae bacterium]
MHRVEVFLRHLSGWALAVAFWRPWRSGRARLLATAERVVVVRIDHRIGEALLTTPLVAALEKTHEVHLVVHPKCARVLEGLPGLAGLHPFERAWLWNPFSPRLRALRALCRDAVVVNAASWVEYSGTPALVARVLGAFGCVVGPPLGPARLLCDVPVPPRPDTAREVEQRLNYLSPLVHAPAGAMRFRAPRATPAVEALVAQHPAFAVVNPGGRLGERRVPTPVFAQAARHLAARGVVPVVTWGPGEEALADEVVAASGAVLAPPTSLDELAFLMSRAQLVLCNNTGPMHLSVAVGAKTVALFWQMPAAQWGHPQPPHVMVELTQEQSAAAMAQRVMAALD